MIGGQLALRIASENFPHGGADEPLCLPLPLRMARAVPVFRCVVRSMKHLRPSRVGSPAVTLSSQGLEAAGVNKQRAHDEKKLDWVKRRCAGETAKSIAALYDTCPNYVSRATNAVRDADVLTACDAEGAYW